MLHEFLRYPYNTFKLFAHPGARRTVMVPSHIWWTNLMGHAVYELGFNVLMAPAWYLFYTSDSWWESFDRMFSLVVQAGRGSGVDLVIGGNTSAMAKHPRTGEMLHQAMGVPVVHYWWDEPRAAPPWCSRGLTHADYLAALRDPGALCVFWDDDVRQEMEALFGIEGSIHVPLGATPALWAGGGLPLRDRPLDACFLGNCFAWSPRWEDGEDPELIRVAERIVSLKTGNLDRGMMDCVREVIGGDDALLGAGTDEQAIQAAFRTWSIIGAMLQDRLRMQRVRALAGHLGDRLCLYGLNWDRIGLRARGEHSGIPGAAEHYRRAKASLNLFGSCVHGGMPLRPFEIACSEGLIFSQYNRELPDLFEPGVECVAFRDDGEMLDALDRILAAPQDFDRVVRAGHRRAVSEHTWKHRLARILDHAQARFDLPWPQAASTASVA